MSHKISDIKEEFSLTIDVRGIELTLSIDLTSIASYKIMGDHPLKTYFRYHFDDFKDDTFLGIIHFADWLTTWGIKNKLGPNPKMNLIERLVGHLFLKIGKTAYWAYHNKS